MQRTFLCPVNSFRHFIWGATIEFVCHLIGPILSGPIRKLVALLLLSYRCISVTHPHDAVGWSAVRDCGIS